MQHDVENKVQIPQQVGLTHKTTYLSSPKAEVQDRTETVEMSSCSSIRVEWQNIFVLSPLFKGKSASDWMAWSDAQETGSHAHDTYILIGYINSQ